MASAYSRSGILVALVLALTACVPTLDWREVRPASGELVVMFPCRPKVYVRTVALAGVRVRMHLTACTSDTTTYALAYASMDDPARVTAALGELRSAAVANIDGAATLTTAWRVPGMTPNPRAEKLVLEGRGAEGKPVREQVAFFVKGMRVYQATIVGERVDPEAVEAFFGSLRLDV